MPSVNFYDSQRPLVSLSDDAAEAARGGRYLAVAISVGFLVWLAMAVALAEWAL